MKFNVGDKVVFSSNFLKEFDLGKDHEWFETFQNSMKENFGNLSHYVINKLTRDYCYQLLGDTNSFEFHEDWLELYLPEIKTDKYIVLSTNEYYTPKKFDNKDVAIAVCEALNDIDSEGVYTCYQLKELED